MFADMRPTLARHDAPELRPRTRAEVAAATTGTWPWPSASSWRRCGPSPPSTSGPSTRTSAMSPSSASCRSPTSRSRLGADALGLRWEQVYGAIAISASLRPPADSRAPSAMRTCTMLVADGGTGQKQATLDEVCEVAWTEHALDRAAWKVLEESFLQRVLRRKAAEALPGRFLMREEGRAQRNRPCEFAELSSSRSMRVAQSTPRLPQGQPRRDPGPALFQTKTNI